MLIKVYDNELEEYHSQLIGIRDRIEELHLRLNHLYNEMYDDPALLAVPFGITAAEKVLSASQRTLKLYQELSSLESAVNTSQSIYERTEKRLSEKINDTLRHIDVSCSLLTSSAEADDEERINSFGAQMESSMIGNILDTPSAEISSTDVTLTMNDVNSIYVVSDVTPKTDNDTDQEDKK